MKKLLSVLSVLSVLLFAGVVQAEEVNLPNLLGKIPALNQAVIFSLDRSEFQYATTVTIASVWEKRIKFDIGYTPSNEIIGLASVSLLKVKKYIDFPILDLVEIEPFLYAGTRRIETITDAGEYDWGVGCKLIAIKF